MHEVEENSQNILTQEHLKKRNWLLSFQKMLKKLKAIDEIYFIWLNHFILIG